MPRAHEEAVDGAVQTQSEQGAEAAGARIQRARRAALRAGALSMLLLAFGCGERPTSPPPPKAAPAPPKPQASAPRPANLLLVTLDTTRADALGIYGQSRPTSPHLDRLAKSGVTFENAVTASPLTLPSHTTILTGQLPTAHGVRSNTGYVLAPGHRTLAEVLRERGYATAAEVAVDVLSRDKRLDRGFDHYRGPSDAGARRKTVTGADGRPIEKQIRSGADISRAGVATLRAHRERPFFLWLHYFDAHQPVTLSTGAQARIPDSRYHAAVATQDAFLGEVLDELARLGLAERTLVVVTSDHGEGLGEHGEDTHGYFVYDTTMRVPLVMAGLPSLRAGLVASGLARTADIAPTVLDLLGAPPLPEAQGRSLAAVATGERAAPALGETGATGYGESIELANAFGAAPLRFAREGRWKYIHQVDPKLFDVAADPGEETNLASQRPEIVERLRAALEVRVTEDAPTAADAGGVDPDEAARLAALGYLAAAPADAETLSSLALSGPSPDVLVPEVDALIQAMALQSQGRSAEALARLQPLAERGYDGPAIAMLTAQVLQSLGRDAEATAAFLALIETTPCDDYALSALNKLLRGAERWQELADVLSPVPTQCDATPAALNNYAWLLATSPDAEVRDGARAVEVAQQAIGEKGRDPAYLDTLAASLAEAGRFDEAIAVQEEALAGFRKAGLPRAVLAEIERHLTAYRAGRPIRDPASS